jgi:hypothetical protein
MLCISTSAFALPHGIFLSFYFRCCGSCLPSRRCNGELSNFLDYKTNLYTAFHTFMSRCFSLGMIILKASVLHLPGLLSNCDMFAVFLLVA